MKITNLRDGEPKPANRKRLLFTDELGGVERHPLSIATLWNSVLARETEAIGRELHDDLGQVLTALRMDISLFKLQHQSEPALLHKADGMLAIADRGMLAICKLIDILRPVDLVQGLPSALESFCYHFSQCHQLPYTLAISEGCDCMDDERGLVLFRILREAMTNIARHAVPCTASIALTRTADAGLRVEISDNGCGIETAEAKKSNGLGLPLMRECTAALGGSMEIRSELNIGTAITLQIPAESLRQQNNPVC